MEQVYTKEDAEKRLAELQARVNDCLDTSSMNDDERAAAEQLPFEKRIPADILRQRRRMEKLVADFNNQG